MGGGRGRVTAAGEDGIVRRATFPQSNMQPPFFLRLFVPMENDLTCSPTAPIDAYGEPHRSRNAIK